MAQKRYDQKQKLTILQSADEIGVPAAAKVAGVHHTTVYDWKSHFEAIGKEQFLAYKPPVPGRGIKTITPGQEKAILDTWRNNPGYGPGQVRNQLRRQGSTISIKSVRQVMKADGYEPKGGPSKKEECNRFEASRPLELTQMDILEFYVNKLKVYLILLLDDFSRFILGWRLLERTSVDDVIILVQQGIDRYGKMEEILTDRGFVFYSWRGINRFERFLENLRIDHTHARPHHPQTLGKVEACNKRIKNELVVHHRFSTMHEAEAAIAEWVDHYNYRRTHQGIGGLLVPAERFHGQADKILANIGKGVDITRDNCYSMNGIDRSIINLVLESNGSMTLYLLGHPIRLAGGNNVAQTDTRGSRHTDPGAADFQPEGC